MSIRTLAAASLAFAVLVGPAFPFDKPAAAAPPAPAAEMKTLDMFDGTWTCEGTMMASPMGPGGKMKTAVMSHTDLGGFWRSGTVKSTMAGQPGAMEGMFHMTYDAAGKTYHMLWVDSMGAWSHTTSPGMAGDTITFTGETMMGWKAMMGRDAFIKGADGSLKHTGEMQMDGKWMPMLDEVCRKTVKK